MKLIRIIMNRLSVILFMILLLWCLLFCFYLKRNFLRETDRSLRLYAEDQIAQFLSNPKNAGLLSSDTSGIFSHSFIPVPSDYASRRPFFSIHTEKEMGNGETTARFRSLQIIFSDAQGKYCLFQARTDISRQQHLLKSVYGWVLFLYFTLLAIILFVNYLVIEKNMQPLYRLLSGIDRFELDRGKPELLIETRVKEFRKLSQSVDRQFKKNQTLYQQQKFFVDNAAHEMQTPIAVCLNRIEEILQRSDLDEKLFMEIASVHRSLKHMSRMQKDMLQLSRIENGAYAGCQIVHIAPLVRQAIENLQEIFVSKKIRLDWNQASDLEISVHPALCRLLIDNLIKNAFVHTPENGQIRILIGSDRFSVANSGSSALDTDKIFERFYQSDSSKGTAGLGLAICRAICEQYGFSLLYAYRERYHFFEVSSLRKTDP